MTDDSMPLPFEIVSRDEAFAALFPDGDPTPETPLGAAYMWWKALPLLPQSQTEAASLSINPSSWDGYSEAAELLSDYAIMQVVEDGPEPRPDLAYVKFIPSPGHQVRAFAPATLDDFFSVALIRCSDGWWRVWGLSKNYFHPASQIFR